MGKEEKELEEKIKKLEVEKGKKEKELNLLEEKAKTKNDELDNSLTNKASEIRNILSITNSKEFDKNILKANINELRNSYESKILLDEEKNNKLTFYRSEPKNSADFQKLDFNFNTIFNQTKELLSREIVAQQIIEKLKDNPELSGWVYKGIEFHKSETTCQFCGSKLPEDLLNKLNKHFSDEYLKLMSGLQEIEKSISDEMGKIEKYILPDKARFFNEFQNEYENEIEEFEKSKGVYINSLKVLQKEIERKKQLPFNSLTINDIQNNSDIENLLNKIAGIINNHNGKVTNFQNEKEEAKKELIDHYTSKYIKDENYFTILDEIEGISKNIQKLETEIQDIKKQIGEIQIKIKAEAIGAERINKYLNKFFSSNQLKVKLTENGKYKLYRGDTIAKYLSTGERSIISLIYFFAKLEETHFDFRNAIIFIDDPVSSLDSNHMYSIYGFLCEKFKDCGQLFITTHNYDFFNLLKDYKRFELQNVGNLYLIKRTQSGIVIDKLPMVLEKNKSEYNYLFSILYEFDQSGDKNNFEMLMILPNVVRRFLEQYIYMKYPDGKYGSRHFKKKFNKFFQKTDETRKQKTLKILDEYSHEENIEHSKRIPDIEELEDVIEFVLNTVESNDKEHFEALKGSFS